MTHISDTCMVLLGTDAEHTSNQRVALKLMRSEEQFFQEVESRHKHELKEKYVVSVLRVHVEDECGADLKRRLETLADLEVCCEGHAFLGHLKRVSIPKLAEHDLSGYRYCVVLVQADRTLQDAIIHEQVGTSWPQVMKIGEDIARALDHLHMNELIHGDLKPLNVLQVYRRAENGYNGVLYMHRHLFDRFTLPMPCYTS
eukprot:scaffold38881_cov30-Prasinocladus_malaysianus.AAC.1